MVSLINANGDNLLLKVLSNGGGIVNYTVQCNVIITYNSYKYIFTLAINDTWKYIVNCYVESREAKPKTKSRQ